MKEWSKDNRGFALLVVILVLLLVSFLASQLVMAVRTELQISGHYRLRKAGRMLAEGGISLGIFRLVEEPDSEYEELLGGLGFLEGKSYETVLSAGKIKYYAVNESGKININSNNTELIERFLEYQGLEIEEISVIVDSLRDWRDNDDLVHLNGAEQDYYQGLEKPYLPRNGNLEDPGEFFLIRGTGALQGKFDPYEVFSVKNNLPKINFNSLTPTMLDFITGGDQEKIRLYHEEREIAGGPVSAASMQQIIGVESYREMSGFLVHRATRPNKFYSITAEGYAGDTTTDNVETAEVEDDGEEARAPGLPATRIRVMVELTRQGFRYLSWKEQRI